MAAFWFVNGEITPLFINDLLEMTQTNLRAPVPQSTQASGGPHSKPKLAKRDTGLAQKTAAHYSNVLEYISTLQRKEADLFVPGVEAGFSDGTQGRWASILIPRQ